ncbi:riboflavin kinase [Patescibacteria group bacterium]|nr:riboflavin kinase [Patescibacteria group bacterium]MBU1890049.1 riboflavin kinase [Patescibacteria group bacterium]
MSNVVKGKVIKGEGLGQKLGFPTANLDHHYYKKHPIAPGVYAARTTVKKQIYSCIVIIGAQYRKPRKDFKIEVYLLKFGGDLVGITLEAQLVKKLRDLQKFTNEEDLISQIQDDIYSTKKILNN